jgi:hypothetical protein
MPQDVIDATADRYMAAYELLTGRPFSSYLSDMGGV